MDELLLQLLKRLEEVGERHGEIYSTVCRDLMREAVHDGFLQPVDNFSLPTEFGLASGAADEEVRNALAQYLAAATTKANDLGLPFLGRLEALQNPNVITERGTTYDLFFGYTPPTDFTESGDWIGDS
jgi:hypothetical protein